MPFCLIDKATKLQQLNAGHGHLLLPLWRYNIITHYFYLKFIYFSIFVYFNKTF